MFMKRDMMGFFLDRHPDTLFTQRSSFICESVDLCSVKTQFDVAAAGVALTFYKLCGSAAVSVFITQSLKQSDKIFPAISQIINLGACHWCNVSDVVFHEKKELRVRIGPQLVVYLANILRPLGGF